MWGPLRVSGTVHHVSDGRDDGRRRGRGGKPSGRKPSGRKGAAGRGGSARGRSTSGRGAPAKGGGGRAREGRTSRGAVSGGRDRRQEQPRGKGSRRQSILPRDVIEDVRHTAKKQSVDAVLGLLERAVEALDRDQPAEAQRQAGEAKRLAPRSGAVREVLGLACYRGERYRDGLRELQAYRRMTGRDDQNHVIADCHRALGAPQKAVPLVRDALRARISPETKAEAVVVGGAALADMKRYDEAVALLRGFRTDADTARPYDLRVWYVLGDVLERAGRPGEAEREFRRILRHDAEAFDTAERLARLSS